jgi:Ca2+-binding RTX toxin-like protein
MVTLVVETGYVFSSFAFTPLPDDRNDFPPFFFDNANYTSTAMVYTTRSASGVIRGSSGGTYDDYRGSGLVRTGQELTDGIVSSFQSVNFSNSIMFGSSPDAYSITFTGLNLNVAAARATMAQYGADDGGRRVWSDIFSGNDTITVNSKYVREASDTRSPYAQDINAGAGSDVVISNLGNDRVIGGTGSNYIALGAGQDLGFAGSSTATALTSDWSVVLGEGGFDTLYAGWGCNAWLDGGSQDDVLTDGFGTDVLIGGAGNDYLLAGTGTNYLIVRAEDVIAGEVDRIYYFANSNATYLQLPTAWAGAVTFYEEPSTTTLVLNTSGGAFYVQVWGVDAAYLNAHIYYA